MQNQIPMHPVFSDVGYTKSTHWRLSTSNITMPINMFESLYTKVYAIGLIVVTTAAPALDPLCPMAMGCVTISSEAKSIPA